MTCLALVPNHGKQGWDRGRGNGQEKVEKGIAVELPGRVYRGCAMTHAPQASLPSIVSVEVQQQRQCTPG